MFKCRRRLHSKTGKFKRDGYTNKNNWIVCSDALEGNPFDGHTLDDTVKSIEELTRVSAKEAFVDKGYRGHDYKG